MHKEPELRLTSVSVRLGGKQVLEDIDLHLKGPGLVLIMGPNGAGKTTLLKTIMGLLKPSKGRVIICGEDVTGNPRKAMRYASYVPQLPPTMHGYPLTPLELLSFTRIPLEKAAEALKSVDVPEEYWSRPIDELSAGLRQRVFIAQAVARETPLILLDEPLSAVDPAARVEISNMLGRLSKERLLLVTCHDPAVLLPYTRHIILLKRRIYASGPPSEALTLENASKVYGSAALKLGVHLHIADSH